MKFSYSVIGDNTRENREWLEKLGYKSLRFFQGKKYLYATTSQRANAKEVWNEPYYGTVDDVDFYVSCGFVPILGNSPLFKAVSAMRDDSDYMQWFITDFSNKLIPTEPMYLCKVKCFNGVLIPYQFHEDGFHIGSGGFHKATLTELQERFKL